MFVWIKQVWDIRMQLAKLVWDIKVHREAVTCFSLFEPGESLLSGSADKTIRVYKIRYLQRQFSFLLLVEESILKSIFILQVWQMVQRKLELIEVIATKEPIQKLDTYGKTIFAITQRHQMKV